MSLVKVSFQVQEEKQVSRAFEATAAESSDMTVPLNRMADVILEAVRLQFESEGTSGLGSKWKALDPDYAAWKLAHFGPHPILVRTGGGKGAMLNRAHAVKVTPQRMVYEPTGEGGRRMSFHQSGHGNPGGGPYLPQRKVLALTTAQKRAAVDRVFSQWLHELRRGPWWQTHT